MNTLKKIYHLKNIKYPWLLIASMTAFITALCFHITYPDAFTKIEIVIYSAVFLISIIWSILNYIKNLKISAIYKKYDNIEIFIKKLTISKDEKIELSQYLNDFVRDMEENGVSREEAVKTAISHFQVKEFAESEQNIFETTTHYYLFGYASIFIGIIIIIQCIDLITSIPFIILAASFTLTLFSIAFVCLFFIYKLIDVMITKK